jgi:GNAT superfamily N-acetyltransferase
VGELGPRGKVFVVHIRRAAAAEAEVAADLYLASREAAGALIPPSVHDADDTRRWTRDDLFPRAEVWFAVEADVPIGLLTLEGDDWLEQLYVLPRAHRRGVGSALIDHAKLRRPNGLQLWAFQSNEPARRFYEAHGFVVAELTDGAGNEERAPDVRYEWRA